MLGPDQLTTATGSTLYGSDGDKLGKIEQIFLDPGTGAAGWLTVHVGHFGGNEAFVPAADAVLDGLRFRVPFSKDQVKSAPMVDAPEGRLSQQDAEMLLLHYGAVSTPGAQPTSPPAAQPASEASAQGVGEPRQDTAMTLSEERLNVDTETVDAGEATLSKHVVTEQQTVTVPVSHEEVRLERTPITDEDRSAMPADATVLADDEQSVTLTQERIVVTKETVPVERARLVTENVTEQQDVTQDVRREELTTDPSELGEGTSA